MAIRNIVQIDEEKCNGCGQCVINCAEGALKIIDGKARLVSDAYCDGLGACLGHCPQDAITIIQRDAEEFDEKSVGARHVVSSEKKSLPCGCSGTEAREILKKSQGSSIKGQDREIPSELINWPVQLKLISPQAPYFVGKDIVIAADCTSFAYGNFHAEFLKDKPLIIACPKLDNAADMYIEKLAELFKIAKPKSITIVRMEVPCCFGLTKIVEEAKELLEMDVKVEETIIGVDGKIKTK